jgi:hypothetical protein
MQIQLKLISDDEISMPKGGWPRAGVGGPGIGFIPVTCDEKGPNLPRVLLSDIIEPGPHPHLDLTPYQCGRMIEKLRRAITRGYARPDNQLLKALLKHQSEHF